MNYKEEIFNIIKSRTKKDFNENTIIRDLGLDSIDMVEMVVEFEEKFNLEIPSNKINGIKTIKDLLEIVENLS